MSPRLNQNFHTCEDREKFRAFREAPFDCYQQQSDPQS